MKHIVFLFLGCLPILSYAMERPVINTYNAEEIITLVNNTDEKVELPASLAKHCKTLVHMQKDFPGENIFPVGDLSVYQMAFVKEYLLHHANNTLTNFSQKLNSLNVHTVHHYLEAANFLDLKPKKLLIKALTAKILGKESCKYFKDLSLESMSLQQAISANPEGNDPSAPHLRKTWDSLNPTMKDTLLNRIPYKTRFASWLSHSVGHRSLIGCNPLLDQKEN